ncbi:sirohydrochlorin chelatase [Paenibacillus macquariensis]|uniref:Sirohydrochlorin ferrochelatase n=1 Tax=Paenibacillus macquariensis TaxID=948756 RepID=A0ABY1KDR7_9BACL|nr:CbiX/SirB N-terminal domain-containing protein [Paenibacillus macquariensis]MEC0093436.1 CbiX/SirB N-terminal domain-containing protein [Paenibacillus macquariensis]OAB26303.1 cobalamin biosynthesis protein CbiX [Paenibacillus macquariensis subsp. macquariensis]SIR66878.1 Sirohydrochlorin ferrochelatase [Paenibacillus macquariensis]
MCRPGVLIISHGSREPNWVALVDESVNQLPLQDTIPVAVSFLEIVEGRLIQDGIHLLEEQGVTDIIVIPLFVSSGSTHVDEIAYALGVKEMADCDTDLEPYHIQANIHYGKPMDDDDDVAQMVWDKVRSLCVDVDQQVILLIGHGSIYEGFRERWEKGISSLALKVQAISGVRVDYALLNPNSLQERTEYWQREYGYQVIVAPLFLSEGYFTRNVIPERLKGLSYRFSGQALLPHPLISQWIGRQVQVMLQRFTL